MQVCCTQAGPAHTALKSWRWHGQMIALQPSPLRFWEMHNTGIGSGQLVQQACHDRSVWLLHAHGSSTPCALQDVSTLRWHSPSTHLLHLIAMWQPSLLLPSRRYGGSYLLAVRQQSSFSLWIVFEFTNDSRTRKIRAGSDFDVIRTNTRTYVRTYVRYKEFFFHTAHQCGASVSEPQLVTCTCSTPDCHTASE